MTTITNFLESSFIEQSKPNSANQQSFENPIWVLNVPSTNLQHKFIYEYAINHNIQFNKPTIHIDLGIHLIRKYPSNSCNKTILENGLVLMQPFENKAYFVVRTPITQRIKQNYLSDLTKKLNSLRESKNLKSLLSNCKLPNKYANSFSLVVQGLQAMIPLGKIVQLQSFISQLSSLDSSIKQVTIISMQKLITKQLQFSLQRISTCLTTLQSHNSSQNTWECSSTVRRYTGYSNEQTYVISYNKTAKKMKVTKKIVKLNIGEETKEQKEMVSSLGFVVKKDEEEKRKQQELRNMIYPHLNKQKECNCGSGQCKGCGCAGQYNGGDQDQDLIILDEQQGDEDDIDV